MYKKPKAILDLEEELEIIIGKYEIDKNGHIKSLKISGHEIMYIDKLSKFKNLTELYLTNNNLDNLEPLTELKKLSNLHLGGNNIKNLDFLKKLPKLKILDLRNNNIQGISTLSYLSKLTTLGLSENNIQDISPLSELNQLLELHLNSNHIKSIKDLSNLINLSFLNLQNNNLNDVTELRKLIKLTDLDLSNNQISNINFLFDLKKIKKLNLSNNLISEVKYLQNLNNLTFLELSNNKISEIDGLFELIAFSELDEVYYQNSKFYYYLNLFGNPLDAEIIQAIQYGGRDGVIKYLESKNRGTKRIEEAKMVLLGEPRAGKTTLQKYLMGLPINEHEESTHDIQISAWKPFESDSEGKNKDIKINLWDFGGQDIQYSLHKLFMTEDTLYIIVLDSTKDQSPLKYLKFLENYAPNSPFIIINNYGDAPTSNTLKIDENYLRENYNGKEGMPILKAIFNRVSIIKAAKLEPSFRKIMNEVEATIKQELLNLKNLNKEFPKEYQLVKSAIEQEYSKPDKHYITMSYYRELCKSLKITDDEDLRKAILDYLNEIGVLRYFKDSPITDRHILNPKWLIDGAYSLIIDDETANNFGVLTKTQARNILKRSKKGFKFEEEESEFIFKTMKFYGLLHSDETEQKVYIPLRFKSLQPTTLVDFYENGKHFAFEFKSDIPEEIISNLIVKHFEEIANHYYWSKGAVFEQNKVRILVKVEDRNIHFYVQGQFHQNYFQILRRTLRKSLERLPGLGYEEIVEFELNNKKIRVVYDFLVDVLTDRLGHYYDHATKIKITENEIIEILGGYFSKQEINQITHVTNNNFYGTFNDNRFQQITIIQELNSLVQATQSIEDRKALEEIRAEIQLLNQTNDIAKKESLGKKLLSKIKQLSTDAVEDSVKEGIKELFPKIVEKGIDWIEKVDFDGIMQIFGGTL